MIRLMVIRFTGNRVLISSARNTVVKSVNVVINSDMLSKISLLYQMTYPLIRRIITITVMIMIDTDAREAIS